MSITPQLPLPLEGLRAIATKDSLARETVLTLIDALTTAAHSAKRAESKYETMTRDRDYWRAKALDSEHTKQLGGTPTGEFAYVCSCGKSYWPCTALDGENHG